MAVKVPCKRSTKDVKDRVAKLKSVFPTLKLGKFSPSRRSWTRSAVMDGAAWCRLQIDSLTNNWLVGWMRHGDERGHDAVACFLSATLVETLRAFGAYLCFACRACDLPGLFVSLK